MSSRQPLVKAAHVIGQFIGRLPRHPGWGALVLGWVLLSALGWLWYLPFSSGDVAGFSWLAWAYSKLLTATLLAMLVSVPLGGIAIGVLLPVGLKPEWRRSARQGIAKVLLLLAAEFLLLLALVPALAVGYFPQAKQAIAPWHITYHTVYVAFPLDDNYGELMVLSCRSLGLCRQVYRSSTDIFSAGEAVLAFNADANQMGLKLEGQWVYVRSPDEERCSQEPQLSPNDLCSFVPNE